MYVASVRSFVFRILVGLLGYIQRIRSNIDIMRYINLQLTYLLTSPVPMLLAAASLTVLILLIVDIKTIAIHFHLSFNKVQGAYLRALAPPPLWR